MVLIGYKDHTPFFDATTYIVTRIVTIPPYTKICVITRTQYRTYTFYPPQCGTGYLLPTYV